MQEEISSCPIAAERTHQRGGEWGPIGTAYMKAADTRMREVGCYG
jgi:hypothetical protein